MNLDAASMVLGKSVIVRWLRRQGGQVRTASHTSFSGRAIRFLYSILVTVPPTVVIGQTGVIILSATLTHALLLSVTTSATRPGAPSIWRWVFVGVGVAMIIARRPIARAWPHSKTRARLTRFF